MLDTPPTVAAGANQTVNQGSPVVVAATFNDPGYEVGATAANYTATIEWGDGKTSPGTVTITPGGPGKPSTGTVSGSHIYDDQGNYTVTVLVADDGGGVGQGSFTATVNDVGPTLSKIPNGVYVPGQPLIIKDTFTEPGIANQDTVTVNWGNGTTSTFDDSSGVAAPVRAGLVFGIADMTAVPGSSSNSFDVTLTNTGTTGVEVSGFSFAITTTSGDVNFSDVNVDTQSAPFIFAGNSLVGPDITSSASGNTVSAADEYAIPNGSVTLAGGQTLDLGHVLFALAATAPPTPIPITFSPSTNVEGAAAPNLVEPTASNPVGSISFGLLYNDDLPHTITVTITDKDGNSDSVSATFVPETTTAITVTSSSTEDTSTYGQSVTFTATISSAGTGVPTGTVEFYDGSTDLGPGSTLSGSGDTATSTFTTAALSAGTHEITAIYTPTGDFTNGSGFVDQMVNKAPLTVTAVLSTSDIGHGDTVPTPTASITGFVNGDTPAVVSGTVTFTGLPTTSSPAGIYTVTPITSGLSATNYDFTNIVSATLNVHPVVTNILVEWGTETMSILNLNRDLPFFDITRLEVTYSDPVNISGTGLTLTSTAGGPTYAPVKVGSGQGVTSETWDLPTAIGIDRLMLALDQANTVAANAPSLKLFGLTSQAFSVLPGDFNGDGVVSAGDVVDVNNATVGPYDVWADLLGTGTVNINDVKLARSKIGTSLPPLS